MPPKVLIAYNTAPLPDHRVKTLASWRKLVSAVDVVYAFDAAYRRTIVDRIASRLKLDRDSCAFNRRILEAQKQNRYDLVFVVKGVNVRPRTILDLKCRGAKVVSWSNDDMWGWHNRSLWFTWAARHYDLVVTQKSYNCNLDELPSLGATVFFQDKAYDPAMHYPIEDLASIRHRHDVVFVGTYEEERYRSLRALAEAGITVNVYGWARTMPTDCHPNLVFHDQHLYGEDYAGVFTGSRICLNFLRKISRDLQTSRSIEIPACRGFMLAERTDEHCRLFEEGVEAEFFGSDDELIRKTRYYLDHEEERRAVAEAGYQRCLHDDYSFDNRMREILEAVGVG
jgi:spore maturation protein CgeB